MIELNQIELYNFIILMLKVAPQLWIKEFQQASIYYQSLCQIAPVGRCSVCFLKTYIYSFFVIFV